MSTTKDSILNAFPDETFLFADGFDEAVIGIDSKLKICYDREKCIQILMKDMSRSEAEEYFTFNVEGSYVGENTPLFIHIFNA